MSNERPKKPKRKVILIDDGFGSPDDPIFKEGWTIGAPLRASSVLPRNTPAKRKPRTKNHHRHSDR